MTALSEKEVFKKITDHAPKNDRIAWQRKHKKLKAMVDANITPLEDQILELTMKKMVFVDDAVALRDVLAAECVHPKEFLVTKEDHVLCKFCDTKLKVNV